MKQFLQLEKNSRRNDRIYARNSYEEEEKCGDYYVSSAIQGERVVRWSYSHLFIFMGKLLRLVCKSMKKLLSQLKNL